MPAGDGLTAAVLKDQVVIGRHIFDLLPRYLRQRRSPENVGATRVRVGDRITTLYDVTVGALGFDPERRPRRGRRGPKGWPDEEYARPPTT